MTILLSTFALVFLRALQSQHVIHGQYMYAAITPFAIAAADVCCVLLVVETGWRAIPWAGTGGAIGVTFAMWVHRRMHNAR